MPNSTSPRATLSDRRSRTGQDPEADVRVLLVEPCDDGWQEVEGRRRHAGERDQALRCLPTSRIANSDESNSSSMRREQELPADCRQRHAAGSALQQRRPDRGLQSLDATAERRLRQVQRLGCAMKPSRSTTATKARRSSDSKLMLIIGLIAPIFAFQSSSRFEMVRGQYKLWICRRAHHAYHLEQEPCGSRACSCEAGLREAPSSLRMIFPVT